MKRQHAVNTSSTHHSASSAVGIAMHLLCLAGLCGVLSGCKTTEYPYKVYPGGFLSDQDYSKLQKIVDTRAPCPVSGVTPRWCYYLDVLPDSGSLEELSITDLLESQQLPGEFGKSIVDAVAKELSAKGLVKSVDRSGGTNSVALVGAITNYKKGSMARAVVSENLVSPGLPSLESQRQLRVEFRIMYKGQQIGAMQAYAGSPRGLLLLSQIGRAISGPVQRQIAEDVAKVVGGMKEGSLGKVDTDYNVMPSKELR